MEEIIELGDSDNSDNEISEIYAKVSNNLHKKKCKSIPKKRKEIKVHVNSVDCSNGSQENSYIKEEIMISEGSDCSNDENSDEEVKIEQEIYNPKYTRQHKPKRKNESLSLITLNCPKCKKISKVFSTTIKSICKDCKINMEYVCNICDLRYGTLLALFRHKKLQCQSAENLTPAKHFIRKCWKCSHSESVSYMREQKQCPNCNKSMSFECIVCSKTWATYTQLGAHAKNLCQLSKTYYCNECDFTTSNHKFMKSHLEHHEHCNMNILNVTCISCAKIFATSEDLKIHESHCNKPYYSCQFCPYRPRFQNNFRLHLVKAHRDILTNENIQEVLNAVIQVKNKNNNTEESISPPSVNIPPSEFSLKYLKTSYCLKCNERKPYRNKFGRCMECEFQLVYECMYCDLKVKNTQLLYRHIHRKHGVIKFRCKHCNRGFKFFGDANDHQKSCISNQTVKCELCDFETRYKYNLKLHYNAVHNATKTVYKCTDCGFEFKTKLSLEKHSLFYCKNNPILVESRDLDLDRTILK